MAINAGSIYASLELKSGNFSRDLQSAQSQTKGFEGAMKNMGGRASKLGGTLTKGLTLPIVGIAAAALKVGSDFEAGMSEVEAISGATGEEMSKLENLARDMGATTKFSAKNHWHTAKKLAA